MKTVLLDTRTDGRWLEFVSEQESALAFHHPVWVNMIAECYGYRPLVFALVNEIGQVTAGTPAVEVRHPILGRPRWVSLPFTDYCPPLAIDDSTRLALTSDLVMRHREFGVSRVDVRSGLPTMQSVYSSSHHVLHTLSLSSDPEAVFRTFKRTHVQQTIRQSERRGVEVRWASRGADMDIFYDLQVRTRRRLGVPAQPKRYFELLWRRVLEPGYGFLLLAFFGDIAVAGGVFLAWNRTVLYKYGASDPAYWRLRPNNQLVWTAIKWGCERGYAAFDFGRTDVGDIGLREFKAGWGTREEPLVYSRIGTPPSSDSSGHATRLAAYAIRRLPPLACRMVGELLYRYSA